MHGNDRTPLNRPPPIPSVLFDEAHTKGYCVRSNALAVVLPMVLLQFAAAPQAVATNYTFTTIELPASFGPGTTIPAAINDAGQIVGYFETGAAVHGFLKDGANFTTFDAPGALFFTRALGINNAGQIVGWFSDRTTSHSFVKDGASFAIFDAPGADGSSGSGTFSSGINDTGQIVGYFQSSTTAYAFLKDGTSYTLLNVPGPGGQEFALNNRGQIVGSFADPSGVYHGFLKDGATYTTLDVPGSVLFTLAFGINDAGQIVGWYNTTPGSLGPTHGFVKDGATYTTVDVPGATGTAVSGINNAGEIVGTYTDGTGFHGFRATPIVVPVQIEVEPFVPKDPIFLNSPIPLPVAVFGSSNVDVTQIDLSSLRFGPKFATPLSTQIVTVNGQTDLVAIFRVQDTGLAVGDTQACLQGEIAGQLFRGCDGVVVIERGCGLGFELAPILSVLLWLRGRRTRKLP